jgi:hypothetical protein
VVDDPGRAGTALVTVTVDDLATVPAVLSARRVAVGAVDGTAPAAAVVDPEGNVITSAA